MPGAVALALATGVTITVFWPKLARVLAYSVAGLSLLVVAGLWAMQMSRPQWLAMLPRDFVTQVAVLVALVGFGVLIQWRLTPAGRSAEKQ
jgi:ACR3 family arsenite efflux pump ArsB